MRRFAARGVRGIWVLAALAVMLASTIGAVFSTAGAPVVSITALQSKDFPGVTADFTAVDASGHSLLDLTTAELKVLEDGSPVSPATVQLTAKEGPPVSLVLALDTSTDPKALTQVQAAAKGLIDSLRPKDQAAIVAFSDTVQIPQAFTADKSLLDGAVAALAANGSSTVLNDALLKAVNLASTAPSPNRLVVVVTNSGDTSGKSTAGDAVTLATAAHLPIYTFSYGSNTAAADLNSISIATGAQSMVLADAGALAGPLPVVEDGFRSETYSIAFKSAIRPDNNSHTLTISVTRGGQTGQGTGNFVAVSHAVDVKIPGLTDGQTVVGKLYLNATAQASAPIVSVEYLLNGQSVAVITKSPYVFEWDSATVDAGSYLLTVRAKDADGNTGEKTVNVQVFVPFAVQVTASANRLQAGNSLTVTANVDTPSQISQVDLLLDGKKVDSQTSAPYKFSVNTKGLVAGDHTLRVQAFDLKGRSATSDLPIKITEAVLPIVMKWVFGGLIVVGIIIVFILGLTVASAVGRAQEKRVFRTIRVELNNQGNARSRYELRADDPIDALSFDFSLNGSALPQRQSVEAGSANSGGGTAAGSLAPQPAAASATGSTSGGKKSSGGALGGAKAALGIASFFGELLASIGMLLPGTMGNSLTSLGYRLRGGEYTVSRLESTAKRAQESTSGPRGVSSTPSIGSQRGGAAQPAAAAPAQATVVGPMMPGVTRVWAQTPSIDPGQTLAITLTLRPLKSRLTQQYFFRVISQAVDAEGVPPITEQGNLQITGLSWFRRALPWFIRLGMLVAVLFLIVLLLVNFQVFG